MAGTEACATSDDGSTWGECAPLFRTDFPKPPDNFTNRYYATDALTTEAGGGGGSAGDSSSAAAAAGGMCRLPFFFRGSLRWDCIPADELLFGDGRAGGATDDNSSSAAAAAAAANRSSSAAPVLGDDGSAAGLTASRRAQFGLCRAAEDDRWQACLPRPSEDEALRRTTVGGQACQLPFIDPVTERLAYDCVNETSTFPGVCLAPGSGGGNGNQMQRCAPRVRKTESGRACVFPFPHGGKNVTRCVPRAAPAVGTNSTAAAGAAGGSGSQSAGSGKSEVCMTAGGDMEACVPVAVLSVGGGGRDSGFAAAAPRPEVVKDAAGGGNAGAGVQPSKSGPHHSNKRALQAILGITLGLASAALLAGVIGGLVQLSRRRGVGGRRLRWPFNRRFSDPRPQIGGGRAGGGGSGAAAASAAPAAASAGGVLLSSSAPSGGSPEVEMRGGPRRASQASDRASILRSEPGYQGPSDRGVFSL